jgi:hypothetical protein
MIVQQDPRVLAIRIGGGEGLAHHPSMQRAPLSTAELVDRVARDLEAARKNPDLKFEA